MIQIEFFLSLLACAASNSIRVCDAGGRQRACSGPGRPRAAHGCVLTRTLPTLRALQAGRAEQGGRGRQGDAWPDIKKQVEREDRLGLVQKGGGAGRRLLRRVQCARRLWSRGHLFADAGCFQPALLLARRGRRDASVTQPPAVPAVLTNSSATAVVVPTRSTPPAAPPGGLCWPMLGAAQPPRRVWKQCDRQPIIWLRPEGELPYLPTASPRRAPLSLCWQPRGLRRAE